MKDNILEPDTVENQTEELVLDRYDGLYCNETYQDFKRAAQGLDLDFNDFIDAAIDACRFTVSKKTNGDFAHFWKQIKNERHYVVSTAHYHFLNFANREAIQALIDMSERG